MIDVLLYNGDLVADKYGDIVLCDSEDADVIQMANNNVLLRFGGNKFHSELGNKIYDKRIKANKNGIEMVQEECTDAIINGDSRIREVKNVIVTLLDDATCMVNYTLIYAKTIEEDEVLDEDEDTDDTDDEDIVDTLEVTEEEEEELVEVDGRTHIDIFNMGGDE